MLYSSKSSIYKYTYNIYQLDSIISPFQYLAIEGNDTRHPPPPKKIHNIMYIIHNKINTYVYTCTCIHASTTSFPSQFTDLRHCVKNQYAVIVMTFKISFQLKKKKICINQFRSKIFIKHKRIQSLSLAEFRLPTVKEDNSLKS